MERPTYTAPPEFTAPDYEPAPEFTPPTPTGDESADLLALQEAEAAHAALVAEIGARNRAAREAAEAAWEQAKAEHQQAWEDALAAWHTARYEAESLLPRHALAGRWLSAQRGQNPDAYPGVECVNREDGLGPRLLGWLGAHPDFAAFAAQVEAAQAAADTAQAAEATDRTGRLQALQNLLADWPAMSDAQRNAAMRQVFPALVRHLIRLSGQ